jgi:hypothetical protein
LASYTCAPTASNLAKRLSFPATIGSADNDQVPHVRGDPESHNGRRDIVWELSLLPLTPELRLEQKGGLRILGIHISRDILYPQLLTARA